MKFLFFFISVLFVFGSSCKGQQKEKKSTTPNAGKYQSLLWEISGNGLEQASYLYGTIHIQDQRVFELRKETKEALKSAKICALELNFDSINPMALMQHMYMENGMTLQQLLTPEDYKLVAAYVRDSAGMPLMFLERVHPIMLMSVLQTKDFKQDQENALDLYIGKEAKKQGACVVGLEKMEEQIAVFKSVPAKKQGEMLVEFVKEGSKIDGMSMEDMLEAYVNEDLDRLMEMTESVGEDSESKVFEEAFLVDRNKIMVERSIPLMQENTTFIAVGAAHLPGEDGIIELLRKEGYTVTAK